MSPDQLEFDDRLDKAITQALNGEPQTRADADPAIESYERLASEMSRVFMEESPRLSPAVQARQLAALETFTRSSQPFRLAWKWGALLRLAQVAAVAVIVVLVLNGLTIASANTLPGSPLYPFKRLSEQSNLFFTPSAAQRARVWMNLANVRLDEAQRSAALGQRVEPELLEAIESSLQNALRETSGAQGSERLLLLEQITDLAERQQRVLDSLAGKAGPADRERIEQTARDLDDLAARAGEDQINSDSVPTATATSIAKSTATSTAPPTAASAGYAPAPTKRVDEAQILTTPAPPVRPTSEDLPAAKPDNTRERETVKPENEPADAETAEPEDTPRPATATRAPTHDKDSEDKTPTPQRTEEHHEDHPSATPTRVATPTPDHDD